MFCQYPTTSLERDHPMGDATGTRKDRESTINQAHCSSRKAIRKAYKSIQDRFLRCPIHRQSQLNIGWSEEHCARLDDIAAEDHSHIATAAERARRENTWVLMLVSSAMNQREDCEENKKLCERLHQESGQAHHRLHPRQVRSRPDEPFAWQKVRNASNQRQAGSGSAHSQQQALLLKESNRLRGGNLLHGHRHQSWVSDFLASDGRCKHYTEPSRTSTRI